MKITATQLAIKRLTAPYPATLVRIPFGSGYGTRRRINSGPNEGSFHTDEITERTYKALRKKGFGIDEPVDIAKLIC